MDKRRLQRTGGSSLTMTLPKHWVTQHNLKHQAVVTTHVQKTGALLIKPFKPENGLWQVSLDINSLTPAMLMRETIGLYVAGIDEIKFHGQHITSQQRSRLRSLIQALIGFEIIDESVSKVIVRNIFDVRKFPLSTTIQKMFLIAEAMITDAFRVTKKDQQLAHDITERDLEVDKLLLILRRQFNSILQDKISEEELDSDRINLSFFQNIAVQLERIADHAVKIATARNLVIQQQSKLSNTAAHQEIFKTLRRILNESASLVQNIDRQQAHQILDANTALEKSLQHIRVKMKKSSPSEVITVDSLDRLRGYLMNIAELTIDQSMNRYTQTTISK
jgi:phosphate uptake regulator